ncbi:threonine/serine exporter ThrE family protein [Algoriphagus sp. A40]|uniref:threonine/serine ThrE exporter family protein n=1 Tax=Algoriphagus sp. A40 TaxID=1945863 RepID=UPI0009844890|nr:threonine/serine exporter family protein [Algoriphagus sp. A40]OOG76814.1 hypothetical protein B0E43_07445 [Algoriphagus sp. A40]
MESGKRPYDPIFLGKLLLEMGILMIHAGAPTRRVSLILTRISQAYGFQVYSDLSTRHLSISMQDQHEEKVFSGGRSNHSLPGVNFWVVSDISNLSIELSEKQLPLEELKDAFKLIQYRPHYPRWLILLVVSFAGAAFCYTFGGDLVEMGITFLATFCGLFLKQELVKNNLNTYIVTYFSALLAAFVIALCWKLEITAQPDQAFATSVLFLVPGVPLVISLVDLLDGYITNGIDRGVNALIHAFGIASGLASVLYVFKIPF